MSFRLGDLVKVTCNGVAHKGINVKGFIGEIASRPIWMTGFGYAYRVDWGDDPDDYSAVLGEHLLKVG